MNAIDRDAVLALLDGVIANPGPSPAAGALALVLRMQVARLPVLAHTHRDAPESAITTATPCPDAETLAAWCDGAADHDGSHDGIVLHLVTCDDCRGLAITAGVAR